MLLYLFCNKSHYENVPFEIPESWCWTTLGELCSIKGGKRLPKGKSFADTITPHIYIRVTDMKDHTVLLSSLKYIDEDVFAEIKNYTISSNDLYLTIAGTIGDVGFVPAELDGANLTENAAKLTDIKCSKQYLMYVLMSSIAQDHFCSRFHQVAQPKLSLETASSTLIPLPPYREQLRIAEELDRWLGVVVSVEDDLSELTNYVRKTKSKILDLAISGKLVPQDLDNEPAIELLKRINPGFEPCDNSHYENLPFEIPSTWVWVSHNDMLEISGGAQPPKSEFSEVMKPGYIRLYQIRDYGEKPIPIYIPLSTASKTTVKGDILLARYGGSLGKVFIAEDGAYNVAMAKVILCYPEVLNQKFVYYYYLSSIYQNKLRSISRTAQAGFNSGDFEDMYFPLPPLEEQGRIVDAISSIWEMIDMITAEL